uniref:Uncharacterized protein n=1 Tax=Romanomermis culicivorax TaxID=13658 RepID=A0A915JRU2_ROMCU
MFGGFWCLKGNPQFESAFQRPKSVKEMQTPCSLSASAFPTQSAARILRRIPPFRHTQSRRHNTQFRLVVFPIKKNGHGYD